MKEKKLILNSISRNDTKKVIFDRNHLKKSKDVHYLHINKISFQQNFKVLMGHFKEDSHNK